jgi:hypothetical protein
MSHGKWPEPERTDYLFFYGLWLVVSVLGLLMVWGCSPRPPDHHPGGRYVEQMRYCRDHHEGAHLPNDDILRPASELE